MMQQMINLHPNPTAEKETLRIVKDMMKFLSFVGPTKPRRAYRIKMPTTGN